MNEIVLDIETQTGFGAGGCNNRDMKISLVGIYRYDTDKFESYLEKELNELWPILEHSSRIIGYNLDGFDMPILNNYYAGDITKIPTLDIMDVIYKELGFRVKLDHVAKATLNVGKSGTGLQAVTLFNEGKLEELKDYCLQDVRLTRDIYEYGKQNEKLHYENKMGKGEVKVNFTPPENQDHSMNLTLPI
ncbi:ribonuclease H-like domain-containing protein [Patescibacteria group bacterium]|nr:ribonuclease H-like domain-containing protein [Patescibacteria group bacterium]MBU1075550.1 ribonuclease H-like domain-containing protein [Patescibacteria group bacterium]MBU1951566.1 ribonuclease H-like domain-containing protein [Patescibacteria group bacterium]